jgi:sialidase-1
VGGAEVLAFIEGRQDGGDAGHIDLVMKRSTNDGADWGPAQVVAGGSGDIARGNPSPVYCDKTGRLLLVWSWNNLDVYVQFSDDKGKTWSDARKISDMVKRPGWGWVATGPGHAIQLRRGEHEGRIVVPFNTFFADALMKKVIHRRGCAEIDECSHYYNSEEQTQDVRVEIENPLDPEMGTLRSRWYNGTTDLPLYVWAGDRSGVFYSDDGGDTWQLGGMVNSRIGSSECQVAETDEGLFISFRVEDKDSGCRKMAFSRDGGQSFEDFFEPEACVPDPVCQGSVVALEDGRLVACGPGSSEAREDTTLHISHGSAERGSFDFALLGLVEKGDGGYSDVVLLEPSPSGKARVGVIWEHGFAGGAGYAVVDMPSTEETEFKDPEDPWAALV